MADRRNMPVREWLGALGVLCAGGQKADDTRTKMAAMAPLLADAFPVDAFTYPSLRYCAERAKFWPTFHELSEWLGEWWAENRPRPTALPGPDGGDGLDAMDRRWVDFWWRRKREIEAGRSDDGDPFAGRQTREAALRNLVSLVRQQSPKAWAVVSGGVP